MRNAVYELVETNDSLPFDVSLNSVNYVPSHWHNSVEIIFVLRGTVEIRLSHEKRTLSEGDVLLINQCHVHEVIGLDRNIIATAEFNYLKVECEAYAAKLAQSGVPTKLIQYNGTDHAFMDKIGLYPQAEDLMNEIAKEMKRVFA